MINLTRVRHLFQSRPCWSAGAFSLIMWMFLAGCRTDSGIPAPNAAQIEETPDLEAIIARASRSQQPIFVLVAEVGASRADDHARRLLESLAAKGQLGNVVPVLLDLSISRNRATAARFHPTTTPVLLGLSPKGLIITRDETEIPKDLVLHRVEDIQQRGPELDAKLAGLDQAITRRANDPTAQWALADFLLAQKNAREAIPHLEIVARNEAAATTLRVRAWVELARAHIWIAEIEKGRHEASDLMAVLGPRTAEARAGGDLIFGLLEANAKHPDLARPDLKAAIAAAPQSLYGKQAAEALAQLPN